MIEIAPRSPRYLSIEETFLYVITCYYNNHADWRLPTSSEADENDLDSWRNSTKDNWAKSAWDNPSHYRCTPVRTTNVRTL
jgi:hypothetical protein